MLFLKRSSFTSKIDKINRRILPTLLQFNIFMTHTTHVYNNLGCIITLKFKFLLFSTLFIFFSFPLSLIPTIYLKDHRMIFFEIIPQFAPSITSFLFQNVNNNYLVYASSAIINLFSIFLLCIHIGYNYYFTIETFKHTLSHIQPNNSAMYIYTIRTLYK